MRLLFLVVALFASAVRAQGEAEAAAAAPVAPQEGEAQAQAAPAEAAAAAQGESGPGQQSAPAALVSLRRPVRRLVDPEQERLNRFAQMDAESALLQAARAQRRLRARIQRMQFYAMVHEHRHAVYKLDAVAATQAQLRNSLRGATGETVLLVKGHQRERELAEKQATMSQTSSRLVTDLSSSVQQQHAGMTQARMGAMSAQNAMRANLAQEQADVQREEMEATRETTQMLGEQNAENLEQTVQGMGAVNQQMSNTAGLEQESLSRQQAAAVTNGLTQAQTMQKLAELGQASSSTGQQQHDSVVRQMTSATANGVMGANMMAQRQRAASVEASAMTGRSEQMAQQQLQQFDNMPPVNGARYIAQSDVAAAMPMIRGAQAAADQQVVLNAAAQRGINLSEAQLAEQRRLWAAQQPPPRVAQNQARAAQ